MLILRKTAEIFQMGKGKKKITDESRGGWKYKGPKESDNLCIWKTVNGKNTNTQGSTSNLPKLEVCLGKSIGRGSSYLFPSLWTVNVEITMYNTEDAI